LIILQMDKATGISKLSKTHANRDMPSSETEDSPLQTTAAEEAPDESN
jgi:hypothetical protein